MDCLFWFNNQNFFSINQKQNLIEWNLNETPLNVEKKSNKYEFLDNQNSLLRINDLKLNENNDTYSCSFKSDTNEINKSLFTIFVGSNTLKSNKINY